jgi:hypothetical protein
MSSRFATSIILHIAYGFRLEDSDSEYPGITAGVSHSLSGGGSMGGTPIDLFPFCKPFLVAILPRGTSELASLPSLVIHMPSYFPGTYYANFARKFQNYVFAMHNVPYARVEKDLVRPSLLSECPRPDSLGWQAASKAKPSFLSQHLEGRNNTGDDYRYKVKDLEGAAGVMYVAGAETVCYCGSTTQDSLHSDQNLPDIWYKLLSFLYATCIYPDVQKRAQEEIDAITSTIRDLLTLKIGNPCHTLMHYTKKSSIKGVLQVHFHL